MAAFTTTGNIFNSLNGRNLRNVQRFKGIVSWTFDEDESFVEGRIIDDSEIHIPRGLTYKFSSNELVIEGLPDDVDLYHPELVTYLWSGFRLDGTEFKTEDSDEKAVIDDIKNQDMHYTGKSWGTKGIAGYYRDNKTLTFPFEVEIKYKISSNDGGGTSGNNTNNALNPATNTNPPEPILSILRGSFYITVVPNMDPKIFCMKYGVSNGFTDSNGDKIGFDEYQKNMESLGFNFLLIDRTQP